MLLDAGANLACLDKDLTTPLHLCCAEGSIEVRFFENAFEELGLTENPVIGI